MSKLVDWNPDRGRALLVTVLAVAMWALPQTAGATTVTGTVSFQGQVVFPAPIAGIALDDMVVTPASSAEATGSGVKCNVLGVTGDAADVGGAYPSGGAVTAEITMDKGGPNPPEGECLIILRAYANDGASVSARGFTTVSLTAADIDTSATLSVDDIEARGSKTVAGVDKLCLKWMKKQLKLRSKCNWFLLKLGPDAVLRNKCKDAGEEPPDCDNGDYVPEVLALAHGDTDQQTDPEAVTSAIDVTALLNQLKCQRFFGKAATNFLAARTKLVQNKCIKPGADTETCRVQRTKDASPKFKVIDNCLGDQTTDIVTGLLVPDLGSECADACISAGVIDTKCVKACLQQQLSEASDGLIGDLPECGNGVLQQGEGCDDGNLLDGDCCSSICAPENLGDQSCGMGACEVTVGVCSAGAPQTCTPADPGVEGPFGDATCSDGIDNDCDGTTDAADTDCNP